MASLPPQPIMRLINGRLVPLPSADDYMDTVSSPATEQTALATKMPIEVVLQIISYLPSASLLALSRTSKSFRLLLRDPRRTGVVSQLWKAARQRSQQMGLLNLDERGEKALEYFFDEVQGLALIVDGECHLCKGKEAPFIDYTLRLRTCEACWNCNYLTRDAIEKQYFLYGLHPSTLDCVPISSCFSFVPADLKVPSSSWTSPGHGVGAYYCLTAVSKMCRSLHSLDTPANRIPQPGRKLEVTGANEQVLEVKEDVSEFEEFVHQQIITAREYAQDGRKLHTADTARLSELRQLTREVVRDLEVLREISRTNQGHRPRPEQPGMGMDDILAAVLARRVNNQPAAAGAGAAGAPNQLAAQQRLQSIMQLAANAAAANPNLPNPILPPNYAPLPAPAINPYQGIGRGLLLQPGGAAGAAVGGFGVGGWGFGPGQMLPGGPQHQQALRGAVAHPGAPIPLVAGPGQPQQQQHLQLGAGRGALMFRRQFRPLPGFPAPVAMPPVGQPAPLPLPVPAPQAAPARLHQTQVPVAPASAAAAPIASAPALLAGTSRRRRSSSEASDSSDGSSARVRPRMMEESQSSADESEAGADLGRNRRLLANRSSRVGRTGSTPRASFLAAGRSSRSDLFADSSDGDSDMLPSTSTTDPPVATQPLPLPAAGSSSVSAAAAPPSSAAADDLDILMSDTGMMSDAAAPGGTPWTTPRPLAVPAAAGPAQGGRMQAAAWTNASAPTTLPPVMSAAVTAPSTTTAAPAPGGNAPAPAGGVAGNMAGPPNAAAPAPRAAPRPTIRAALLSHAGMPSGRETARYLCPLWESDGCDLVLSWPKLLHHILFDHLPWKEGEVWGTVDSLKDSWIRFGNYRAERLRTAAELIAEWQSKGGVGPAEEPSKRKGKGKGKGKEWLCPKKHCHVDLAQLGQREMLLHLTTCYQPPTPDTEAAPIGPPTQEEAQSQRDAPVQTQQQQQQQQDGDNDVEISEATTAQAGAAVAAPGPASVSADTAAGSASAHQEGEENAAPAALAAVDGLLDANDMLEDD